MTASGLALVPSLALASNTLIVDRWDNTEPWPGLKVRCLDLVTGYQVGLGYYLEHPSDELVRYMLPLCVMDAREHGRPIPETDLSECRPEYRERIAESLAKSNASQMGDILAKHSLEMPLHMPQHGLLVREKVNVQIAGPADIMARHDHEIPKGWERCRSVPTDVAAVLAANAEADRGIVYDYGRPVLNKEADVLSRYFYMEQTQVEIAEAWVNSQPTICYRLKRGMSLLSESQQRRVRNGWA